MKHAMHDSLCYTCIATAFIKPNRQGKEARTMSTFVILLELLISIAGSILATLTLQSLGLL